MKFSYLAVLAIASTVVSGVQYQSVCNPNVCIGGAAIVGSSLPLEACPSTEWTPNPAVPSIQLFGLTATLCWGGGAGLGGVVTLSGCTNGVTAQMFTHPQATKSPIAFTGVSPALCIGIPADNATIGNSLVLENCVPTPPGDSCQLWTEV